MALEKSSSDPIKHVVVLMLENRSFDQMLGCFKEKYPHLEGVDPHNPHENRDELGNLYRQQPTRERQMALALDPQHEGNHVRDQNAAPSLRGSGRPRLAQAPRPLKTP